jgi:hypothetical protein
MKREPSAWEYNWTYLFMRDISKGIWSSRLARSRIWDRKIWSLLSWSLDPRISALARANSKCKLQIHPLAREGVPHQQTRSCLTLLRIWPCAPDGCLRRRSTDWLTVGRKMIWSLTLTASRTNPAWRKAEYLHRSLTSRKRWQKGESVSGL